MFILIGDCRGIAAIEYRLYLLFVYEYIEQNKILLGYFNTVNHCVINDRRGCQTGKISAMLLLIESFLLMLLPRQELLSQL